jgi:two-component system, LytTR family, sensor kinase
LTNHPLENKWFIKYKLYHIPFWLVYHIASWTITIGSVTKVFEMLLFTPYFIKFLFYVVFQAIAVYFNLYFLIPRYLEKGKYAVYLAFFMVTIVCMAVPTTTGYYVSAYLSDHTFQQLFQRDPSDFFHFYRVNALPSTLAIMTLAMSVKLTKNWIQTKRREQILEKEKLETELKFLKSQFNPHFLFNTINSIFVLIRKNPEMASEALAKFSDLLRYQLYECNESQIPLDQELAFLENFIELEKLRQDKNLKTDFSLSPRSFSNLTIAPFVLMPFIENAFKHVSQRKDGSNWIKMQMEVEQHNLYFTISNSVAKHTTSRELINYGGIGLKNVQRRLDLLYPKKHLLTTQEDQQQFCVSLTLELQHTNVNDLIEVSV